VRLRHDAARSEWVLLGPERVFKPDGVALEILKRCEGSLTLDQIVDELAIAFTADRAEVDRDVREFLTGLHEKGVVDL